jgi:hypothetical protein
MRVVEKVAKLAQSEGAEQQDDRELVPPREHLVRYRRDEVDREPRAHVAEGDGSHMEHRIAALDKAVNKVEEDVEEEEHVHKIVEGPRRLPAERELERDRDDRVERRKL